MRRSCDRCGKFKKKCDGAWPCRRCRLSENECTYSKRRPPHPPQQQQQQQHARPATVHATSVVLQHSTSAALKRGEDCTETSPAPNLEQEQQQGGPTRVGDGNADQKGSTSAMQGMRRSCDRCGKFKKRCDGEWPCRRCRGSGIECSFSRRRPSHPQHQQQGEKGQQHTRPAGVHPTMGLLHRTSGPVLAYSMVSFKRCRLSASAATGLVGMQENDFLSDFFGCIGFMPLATQSQIREAMVKMLARPAIDQPLQEPHDCDDSFDALESGDSINPSLRGHLLPKDLSTCVFWCAVGLGALVKGNPIESVTVYSSLARDALDTYSGPANAEVARAWTILAYLYLFCGDRDMFGEYVALSASFLSASMEQGLTEMLPVGFADIVQYSMGAQNCGGEADDKAAPIYAQEQAPPQLGQAATEYELYSFVMRWWRMMEENVYSAEFGVRAIAGQQSREGEADKEEDERDEEAEETDPRLFGAYAAVLDSMIRMLKECTSQFGRLEETVDRAGFRDGIGGLWINGTLFFEKAFKGDFPGTLERVGRCVEVFEKFPGLCRCETGAHAAHDVITALAAMDGPRAGELYNKLRTIYNVARLPDVVPLPPLEEWQGISHCCELGHCRAVERVILSGEMSGFSMGTDDTSGIDQKDTRTKGVIENHVGVDVQANGFLTTSIISDEIAAWPPTSSSCEAGCDLPDACKADSGRSLLLRGGAELRTAPPTLAPMFPWVLPGETQAVVNAGLGCGGEMASGRTRGDGVAEPPETSLTGPGFSGWGGETHGTRNEDELAVEDWLEVAEALIDAVADP